MARTRSIKPEFWDDEKLAKLSRDVRLLFIGTWKCSDDYGVCKGNHSWLKAQIFPYDDIAVPTFSDWMQQLEEGDFLIPFVVNGENFYYIKNFTKHQKIQHPSPSRNPFPPEVILNHSQISQNDIQNGSEEIQKPISNDSGEIQENFLKDSRIIQEPFHKIFPQTETETETKTETETETKDMATAVATPFDEENSDSASADIPIDPEAIKLTDLWIELMKMKKPQFAKHLENGYLKKWQGTFDRLLRIDKRDPPEIAQIVQKCFEEGFWWADNNIIRTPLKLRKRDKDGILYYDRLLEAMKKDETHQGDFKGNGCGRKNPAPYGDGKPFPVDIIYNVTTGEFKRHPNSKI